MKRTGQFLAVPNALSETETENGAETCIHLREDLYFDQPTGPRIEIEEDMKAVNFFQLYFTDTVWNHIVDQRASGMIILVCSVVYEFKAWNALTLNMGIMNKPSLHLYWSAETVLKSVFLFRSDA